MGDGMVADGKKAIQRKRAQQPELRLASYPMLIVALIAYFYMVYSGLRHVFITIHTGEVSVERLHFDMDVWMSQYALEVWLALGMGCCVLQYGGRTWTSSSVLEHHLSALFAGCVGKLYTYWSKNFDVYKLFGQVFISILVTQANEMCMVISALGGERFLSRRLGLAENQYPIERVRVCLATLMIANLSTWEVHLLYNIIQEWLTHGYAELLMFWPFVFGALCYHVMLLRLNIYKVQKQVQLRFVASF